MNITIFANCQLKTCSGIFRFSSFVLLLSFYIINSTFCISETRYVSHTGSSTPPYTSWETAADSIQKAIDICETGDTVLVANSVYKETILVNKTVHLIGSSIDSTIIDGSQPLSFWVIRFNNNNSSIENFSIYGPGMDVSGILCVVIWYSNVIVKNCLISNVQSAISITSSSPKIKDLTIKESRVGIFDQCPSDTCKGIFNNNLMFASSPAVSTYIIHSIGGSPTYKNNIIIGANSSQRGVSFESQKRVIFKNNLVSGFQNRNIYITLGSDTSLFINNNSLNSGQQAFHIGQSGNISVVRNNIIQNANVGISGPTVSDTVSSDYNLFNNVNIYTIGNTNLGEGNVFADPMFVNDTLPVPNGTYDLHLQAYSPAIDAGDPNILDVDGSRSDIGMFGGPLGEKYTYKDLAPKPPANLNAVYQDNAIHLNWIRNIEADLSHYRIYRDTVPNFIYDISKMIGETTDTTFIDILPDPITSKDYYYKITAFDNQGKPVCSK